MSRNNNAIHVHLYARYSAPVSQSWTDAWIYGRSIIYTVIISPLFLIYLQSAPLMVVFFLHPSELICLVHQDKIPEISNFYKCFNLHLSGVAFCKLPTLRLPQTAPLTNNTTPGHLSKYLLILWSTSMFCLHLQLENALSDKGKMKKTFCIKKCNKWA